MQLEEMRMARKMGEEDPALQAELSSRRNKIRRPACSCRRRSAQPVEAWDAGDEAARQAAQRRMVALLDRRRYLSNLVRDVTETLGA